MLLWKIRRLVLFLSSFYTKQCVSRNLNELFNDILRIGNLHVVDTHVLLRKDESLGLAEKRKSIFQRTDNFKEF